ALAGLKFVGRLVAIPATHRDVPAAAILVQLAAQLLTSRERTGADLDVHAGPPYLAVIAGPLTTSGVQVQRPPFGRAQSAACRTSTCRTDPAGGRTSWTWRSTSGR